MKKWTLAVVTVFAVLGTLSFADNGTTRHDLSAAPPKFTNGGGTVQPNQTTNNQALQQLYSKLINTPDPCNLDREDDSKKGLESH